MPTWQQREVDATSHRDDGASWPMGQPDKGAVHKLVCDGPGDSALLALRALLPVCAMILTLIGD